MWWYVKSWAVNELAGFAKLSAYADIAHPNVMLTVLGAKHEA
jgi:hypothetical protein